MQKYLQHILLLLLLSPIFGYTQYKEIPVSLNWESNNNKIFLNSQEQYIYDNSIYVVLSDEAYKVKQEFEIKDLNFIDVEVNKVPDSLNIEKEFFYEIDWTKGRNGWIPVIKIKPLFKSNNGLKLLSSFKLLLHVNNDKVIAKTSSLAGPDISFEFKESSVLSTGSWVKISVDKSGVYKIDNTLMGNIASQLGVSISDIDPRNISLYGQHGGVLPEVNSDYDSDDLEEISIEVIGEDDGVFGSSDYILFYAEGPDVWKTYNHTNVSTHVKNIYSDKTCFFITINSGLGKRISSSEDIIGEPVGVYDSFNSYYFHEIDDFNLKESGQQWFGERFEKNPSLSLTIPFPNRDVDKEFIVKTRVGAHPTSASNLDVKANSTDIYNFSFSRSPDHRTSVKTSTEISGQENINIDFSFTYGGEGECLLDYVEINAISKLVAADLQFSFRNIESSINGGVSEYRISNPSLVRGVWNVTDPVNPSKVPVISNTGYISFKDNSEIIEEYQLLFNNDFYIPNIVGEVENQNLHAQSAVDYVIVTHKDFINSANKLADFHRNNGLSVVVVDVAQVYNEYSSGRQDIVAIRQFVRMVYARGGNPSKLKYLLMFGDASYDYKDRIENNTNFVPAYQSYNSTSKSSSYVSDDYYGFMDDHEGGNISGSDLIDIGIGRIPIMSNEEGEDVVNKIIGYNSFESLGDWRNKIQIIADDITHDVWEAQLMRDSEALSVSINARNSNYNHQKVYLDTYKIEKTSGGNFYPQAHIDFMQNVQNGNLVTNYFGHGSEVKWTGEGLFEIDDVEKFSNNENLPLFITVTCEFSRYDNPATYTGGEKLLAYKNGGGVGLISTTREITVSFGSKINEKILEFLLPAKGEEYVTIGEVLRKAKNSFPSYRSRRTVSLLGDPALKLAYPKKEIFVSSINYEAPSDSDTIKSLMKVNITGEIRYGGEKDINFNGIAFPLVYDKKQELESLDNNNFGIKIPYWQQKNVIYKGKSIVKNGEFSMEFVVPKDINYSYGLGKLSFYAKSDDVGITADATGDNSQIIVGGIDVSSEIDTKGPEMSLYMNNKFFVDGGITNSSPLLIVDLEDISGINTVGNGIGHDLKMTIISGETKQEVLLNEFYESEIDDFTKGKVAYQMFGLTPGEYTVEVVAWDVFNNSSSGILHFIVKDDDELIVKNIYNYPNPFNNETTFSFSHNRPNEELFVRIEIFTISGLLIKTIIQNNNYDGFVVNDIVWDGKSDSGAQLPSGTYIYRINSNSESGSLSNQEVNKLIIIR